MEILKLDNRNMLERAQLQEILSNTPLQFKCWQYKEMDKGGLEDGK